MRLPSPIRDQLNQRLQDNEPAKTILEWLNNLPEVKTLLAAEFDGRPVNEVNLSDWRKGAYREWLARQEAAGLLQTLHDASSDKDLTEGFNQKLAQWTSIHLGATAQALIAQEEDSERKWSRLRQLCIDITRLRRSDFIAGRLDIDRQRLELERKKCEGDFEDLFWKWTQRPDIRAKLWPKKKEGISKETLKLIDDYLGEGISPLDPTEVTDLRDIGRYASKPPRGFKVPDEYSNGTSSEENTNAVLGDSDQVNDPLAAIPVQSRVIDLPSQNTGRSAPSTVAQSEGSSDKSQSSEKTKTSDNIATETTHPESATDVPNKSVPANDEPAQTPPAPSTPEPQPSVELCHICASPVPPLLPNGERLEQHCRHCKSRLRTPGAFKEYCPKCNELQPELGRYGHRYSPCCVSCGIELPPLPPRPSPRPPAPPQTPPQPGEST